VTNTWDARRKQTRGMPEEIMMSRREFTLLCYAALIVRFSSPRSTKNWQQNRV